MYPKLANHVVLRLLEHPVLYNFANDELYELENDEYQWVRYFTGYSSLNQILDQFNDSREGLLALIEELKGEGLIEFKQEKTSEVSSYSIEQSTLPSLRTILLHVTTKCNLTCLHCYLDKSSPIELDLPILLEIVQQFDQMQGLKLLISGGEPLLHSKIFEFLEKIRDFKIRKILLSNGLLIDKETAERLKDLVNEVQISIDGIKSHDRFRDMNRAFEKSIAAIKTLQSFGIHVSVATMIHKDNIDELPELEQILENMNIESWMLDAPSPSGDFLDNLDLQASVEDAAKALKEYGWGYTFEDSSNIYACGAHLVAIMSNGDVAKCGFFEDNPVGNLNKDSLLSCWEKIKDNWIWGLDALNCRELDCPHLADCKGGCRFRAFQYSKNLMGEDPVKCGIYGFKSSRFFQETD
jgi:radical SAM protein with 4Fe4S-binding SPASM domain